MSQISRLKINPYIFLEILDSQQKKLKLASMILMGDDFEWQLINNPNFWAQLVNIMDDGRCLSPFFVG